MPNYNQEGPANKGPLTGKGMGYCVSDNLQKDNQNFGTKPRMGMSSNANPGRGMGMGRGMSRGRGFGSRGRCGMGVAQRFNAPKVQDIDAEIQNLENLKKQLQSNGR